MTQITRAQSTFSKTNYFSSNLFRLESWNSVCFKSFLTIDHVVTVCGQLEGSLEVLFCEKLITFASGLFKTEILKRIELVTSIFSCERILERLHIMLWFCIYRYRYLYITTSVCQRLDPHFHRIKSILCVIPDRNLLLFLISSRSFQPWKNNKETYAFIILVGCFNL